VLSAARSYPKTREGAIKRQNYRDAGVDIDAGDALVEAIKPLAKATARAGTEAGLGGFGALFDLKAAGYKDPILVATTDGVGTKLKIAIETGRHDTVGIDLVAMCVNDLVVQGAEPLFFLDYFATGKLDVDTTVDVIGGIARGCELAGCALIGGETAEMPDMYPPGEYDLAGFCVGAVEKADLIDGARVRAGDAIIGIASSGPHSNGYSLIRRILTRAGDPFDLDLGGTTLADALMAPTTIYVKPILELLAEDRAKSTQSSALGPQLSIHGMAHITGGGLTENIIRVVPDDLGIALDSSAWTRPAVFDWLEREGRVAPAEMWRTFNCGIGYTLIVPRGDVAKIVAALAAKQLSAWQIGEITTASGDARVRIA